MLNYVVCWTLYVELCCMLDETANDTKDIGKDQTAD